MRAQSSYVNRQAVAVVSPTLSDIAWAAGIFEGEGTVNKTGAIDISQKDPWLLLKLQSLFGGTVATYQSAPTYWRWYATGSRGRGFAQTIYSFLSPRRKQQINSRILRLT